MSHRRYNVLDSVERRTVGDLVDSQVLNGKFLGVMGSSPIPYALKQQLNPEHARLGGSRFTTYVDIVNEQFGNLARHRELSDLMSSRIYCSVLQTLFEA